MHRSFFLALCCLAMSSAGCLQAQTIAFNSAQEYTGNFNEILDAGASTGPGNFMNYYAPDGAVRIVPDSFPFAAAGTALYNPNASTTTTGPTYSSGTVSCDVNTYTGISAFQNIGVLARTQTNGNGIYAYFSPQFNSPTSVFIVYGNFATVTPTISGTLYSGTVNFLPTHISLVQASLPDGSPYLDFSLTNTAGNVFDTGFHALTQTTAYNNPGEVGFRMLIQYNGPTPEVDNFSLSSAVPEPGTSWLCGLAVLGGGVAAVRRSRRARTEV